jgi:hypothetical protein
MTGMIPPYTSKQCAHLLGMTTWNFQRVRARLHAVDAMPAPIVSFGKQVWERAGFDLWRMRFHPFAPKPPANDLVAMPPAASDEAQRERLQRVYGDGR